MTMNAVLKQVPGKEQAAKKEEAGRHPGRTRIRRSLLAASVAVLTFVVYLPALQNGFVWDDVQYITGNSFIRSLNGNLFRSAFLEFQADNWHPLTWLSHALDYSLWGVNPLGHHLTSIVLHALNTMLVVLLVMQLVEAYQRHRTGGSTSGGLPDDRIALIAGGISGLLFGLHPVHVESVAWVSERKDLLCALFFFLSIMTYAAATEKRTANDGYNAAGPRSIFTDKRYFLALGLFILSLLSKPMAVTLPVVLLLLDWFPYGRIRSSKMLWTAAMEKLPFFALSLATSVLAVLAQKGGGAMAMMQPVPFAARLLVGARSLIAYLGKMLVPLNLVPYYPYPDQVPPFSPEYLASIALIIVITLFCALISKRQKVFLSVWGYFVVTLLPVLGIVQVGTQAMADRYLYLPSIGPFFLLGLAAAVLWERFRASLHGRGTRIRIAAGAVAAAALFAPMSYATIEQIGIWRDNTVLWTYVIAKGSPDFAESPRSAMAHNNLGLAYASQGRWDLAATEFRTAVRLKPDYVEPRYNLGIAYARQGRLDSAIAEYHEALRLKPDSAGAHNNLGIAYASQGRLDEAIAEFRTTAQLKPEDAGPHSNLGLAYAAQGRWSEATAEFRTAARLTPDDARPHYDLGNVYASQGLWDQAIAEYRTALQLRPDFLEARRRLDDIVSRRR
jgi:Flp pilus assembly protein TadD